MVTADQTLTHFEREFWSGSDEDFKQLVNCAESNIKRFIDTIKLNILDKIIGRTIDQKAQLFCNLHCIRTMRIKNCKYGGRWVFMYLFGFCEFFSSAFALIKFSRNCIKSKDFCAQIKNSPIKTPLLLQFVAMTIAFMFSFFFHLHENEFTRKGDYFSAVLGIIMNANCAMLRNLHIYSPQACQRFSFACTLSLISIFLYHVYVMNFVSFDYQYNFKFCTVFVILTKLNETISCVFYKNKHLNTSFLKLVVATVLAALFELSDFPPLFFLLDSHAMWHLSLLLSLDAYYHFTLTEVQLCLENDKKKESHKIKPIKDLKLKDMGISDLPIVE
ncbi:hypothetical protein NUSPORA_01040 [Nucleospora cyclopteri]